MNNNGVSKKKNYGKNREEFYQHKAEMLAKQTKNLDIIASAAEYLDDLLKNGQKSAKISMQEILTYLTETKGYTPEDTKVISQFNYIMMELANARSNDRIDNNRLNIRVLYIQERLKTSYKKELHTKIDEILSTYNVLFGWNEATDANEYDIELTSEQ